jgi:hypothetical protein
MLRRSEVQHNCKEVSVMQDATRDHLVGQNMLSDGKVNWKDLVEATRVLLLERLVTDEAEIPEKALSIKEIREQILGDAGDDETNAQLNQLVTAVTGIGVKGRLQKALENGYVLCTTRIHKVIKQGESPTSVPVRFISGDADLVDRFNTQPQVTTAVKRTEAAHAAIVQNTKRVVLLAPRKPLLLQRAQEQLAMAMPLDSQS